MQATDILQGPNYKIAILLVQAWHGGMERNAWALADLLSGLRGPDGRPIEVVIGLHREGGYDWQALEVFARSHCGKLSIRPLNWVTRSTQALKAMFPNAPISPLAPPHCSIPADGVYDFLDCDAWLVFSNTYEGYVPPLRPTSVYSADHIYRYVPLPKAHITSELVGINEASYLYWRGSRCVFCTTPWTLDDTISFAGVAASKTLLLPTLVDPVAGFARAAAKSPPPGDYILWVTNTSPHKNHAKAAEALRIYWTELGGDLDVVICGSYSDLLKPGSGNQHTLALALENGVGWSHRVRFAGHVDDNAFFDLINRSAFVWHNVIMDNGTFVAFDAARAGRSFVSSDYPAMRYLAERYGIDAVWFPASDPTAAAAALLATERKVRAGEPPAHNLRADDPGERALAYQRLVDMVLA